MSPDRRELTVQLPDGRALGYAEFGDPHGYPVFSFHGGMSSRLDIDFADSACAELGVRMIGVDRPGMGLSDHQPKRSLLDWPADVGALADALGAQRFGLYGWSAGGPYALVCGAAIPERVSAIAVLGSAAPYETIMGLRGLNRTDQLAILMSRWTPPALGLVLKATLQTAKPEQVAKAMKEGLPPVDVEHLDTYTDEELAAMMGESLRSGTKGAIADFRILGAPWGFNLTDISVPVDLWIGTEDDQGPDDEQERLESGIPDAVLHVKDGDGHINLGPANITEILTALLARGKS